jgi:NhaA family Na+:H+ antiporter
MATDIAFSYLVARFIFGPGHVAIPFLLLLAIADDAGGLLVLAIAYPQHSLHVEWLALAVVAVLSGFALRKMKCQNFWWYLLIPGTLCWFAFYQTGIHPALGLVPIIPTLPHAHTDLGIFARNELKRDDTLNAFEHWFKNPVEIILGLFGLVNAGVLFSAMGTGTHLVVIGLLVGKPLGIFFFSWLGEKLFKLQLPHGMSYRHLFVVGLVAGIGFTVALFVAGVAFQKGHPAQEAVKMGALLSFVAVPISIIGARLVGVRPDPPSSEPADDAD